MTASATPSRIGLARSDAAPAGDGRWPRSLTVMAVAIAAVLIGHAETVGSLVGAWSSSALYRVAWITLPALAYALWFNRVRISALPPAPTPLGLAAAAAAAALWIAADLTNVTEGHRQALIAMIGAVVLAAVGWRVTLRLLPFLALLVFLVPTGNFLLVPLKHVAVAIVEGLAAVSGLPVETATFVVHVGTHRYVVIDECAGLPFVWMGLFLGLFFGLLLYRRAWRIAALTAVGGIVAVAANALRIIAIVVSDHVNDTQMDLAGHMPYQWAAFVLLVLAMLAVVAVLRPDPPALPPGGAPGEGWTPRAGRLAMMWPLLAAAVAASAPHLAPTPADAPNATDPTEILPDDIAGWSRSTSPPAWTPAVGRGLPQATATYEHDSDSVTVFVARAASSRDKVSGSTVDLIGDTAWMTAWTGHTDACAAGRCLRLHHTKLLLKKSQRVRHVYVIYALGDRFIQSPVALRLLRGWAAVTGHVTAPRLIAVASDAADGLPSGDLASLVHGLHRHGLGAVDSSP